MNTNKMPEGPSACERAGTCDRKGRIKPLTSLHVVVAAFLIAFGSGHAAELPRPGEAIDAGDSYRLRDGSNVALYRLVNEVAIKHPSSTSAAPALRDAGVNQDPLVPLVTVKSGESSIAEIYHVEALQAVEKLLNVQGDDIAAYPVLIDPNSRRRVIATDQIIVQFAGGIGVTQAVALFAQEGLDVLEYPIPSTPGQYLVRIAAGADRHALSRAELIAQRPGVAWAQPNFLCELEFYFVPNDTHFGKQQYLHNTGQNSAIVGADIEAESAWNITTGHPEVVIAIIDTGVDIDHSQELNWLGGKIFLNPNETGNGRESNGIDDDGNGYVDDVTGWDFYSQDNNPRPGPSVDAAHGTACAGIAAAQGNNNAGAAGVAYSCKILPIKITADDGTTFASDFNQGRAIRYAADYADVLSSSWGGGPDTDAIRTAIDYATTSGRNGKGSPALFASGNSGLTWKVRRFPVNVSPGTYAFSFYFQMGPPTSDFERAGLDNIALLGADDYTYEEPLLPRADFETGLIPTGWSLARGGDATLDWLLWNGNEFPEQFHGTGSAWCLMTPAEAFLPPGGWVELRSPYITLDGSYRLRFAYWNNFNSGSLFQVRLLNARNEVLQTIASVPPGLSGVNDASVRFPAYYANSIAIGAVTDHDLYANYGCYWQGGAPTMTGLFCVGPSNEGWNDIATLDIAGEPGENSGNARFDFRGTSAATPCVAGVAALILSKNSELMIQQVKDAIRNGCEQIGDDPYVGGKALHYGYGRANAYNSLTSTAADTTAPTVISVVTKTGRQVEVTFSEKMGNGVTAPGNYFIGGTGKGTLPTTPSTVTWVSGYTYLLEWTSGEMIVGTGNITITVGSEVQDVAGNGIEWPDFGTANGSRVIHAINCGPVLSNATDPIYPFGSERNFRSGAGLNYSMTINSIINNDGTPTGVYKTERDILTATTYPGDILYTLPNFTAGLNHTVRLYFANNGYSVNPGDVLFDVYINNVIVLMEFDLIGAAGGSGVGIWREFSNVTANNGSISVLIRPIQSWNETWNAYYYNATISGIKVTAQ